MQVPDNPMEPIVSPRDTWGMEDWYTPVADNEICFAPLPTVAGASLAEYQQEFRFFTPALLYLYGGFSNNIFQDFVNQYQHTTNLRIAFFVYQAKHPIFQGLEAGTDPVWNYHLFGLRRVHWTAFESFMLSVALAKMEEGVLIRIGYQEVEIADPIVLDRQRIVPTNLPLVTVVSYGVNSTKGAVALRSGTHPLMDPPRIAFHEAQQDHMAFARALWRGQNPHDAMAKWRMEQDGDKNSTVKPD